MMRFFCWKQRIKKQLHCESQNIRSSWPVQDITAFEMSRCEKKFLWNLFNTYAAQLYCQVDKLKNPSETLVILKTLIVPDDDEQSPLARCFRNIQIFKQISPILCQNNGHFTAEVRNLTFIFNEFLKIREDSVIDESHRSNLNGFNCET